MTDKDFLESIDIAPSVGNQTVTIPLDMYNQMFEAHTKLCSIVALYSRTNVFDFKGKISDILGLWEDNTYA